MVARSLSLRVLPLAMAVLAACGGHGGSGPDTTPTTASPLPAHRQFRAIAGVSMGAFGAMNLGTKHADLFSTIAALGGPVDMRQLLRDLVHDNLEVKSQTTIPLNVGDDFTFDHQAPYPGRNTRLSMIKDLVIAFGNPFLHHPDPSRQYLAMDSEPARLLRDDVFGTFTLPANPRGFLDGGDANQDGLRQTTETPIDPVDVLLLAGGSLPRIASGATGVDVGGRMLADLNGDGIYDVGDGIVVNLSEPFTDTNGNGVFDAGEPFVDSGLDGVAGTGDYGENNGRFDYDPDRANWLADDPLTRLDARSPTDIATQRIYMDVGTLDQFGFGRHYDNFVAMLEAKGLGVDVLNDFPANCTQVPNLPQPYLLVRYVGGHTGIPAADDITDNLLNGDVCGALPIWQRLLTMIAYMDSSFPNGFKGPGDLSIADIDPRGDTMKTRITAPSLGTSAGAAAGQPVLIYRPPAFFHTTRSFPIVYILGGYGQSPDDYSQLADLLDPLILANQIQNMFVAVLPGAGGRKASFYVNHRVPEAQVPDLMNPTSGRYEDSIIQDLIPAIENGILQGRVRQ
jgi:enterochelin esterase-like enzyme